MVVLKNGLIVKELIKDIIIDGLIQKYDDSSDFMFVKIIQIGEELIKKPEYQNTKDLVLMLRRINKVPTPFGYYINESDVLAVLTDDEFNQISA